MLLLLKLDCNPILEKNLLDDKVGILDIKAKIDNTTNIDIEMQVTDHKNIEKRILFYLSKMYTKTIKKSQDYNSLEKCIAILISNYNIDIIKNIPKYITKWNIREEEYQKIVLTDVMEIYIIEINKFKDYKEKSNHNSLNSWIEFIESPEVVDMSNKEIQCHFLCSEKHKKRHVSGIFPNSSKTIFQMFLLELLKNPFLTSKAVKAFYSNFYFQN